MKGTPDISVLHVGSDTQTKGVTEVLDSWGGISAETLSLTKAVEMLEEGFDCVIGSYEAASHNGYEILDACKDDGVPFVLFGGHRRIDEALSAGATDYVPRDGVKKQHRYAALSKSIENAVRMNRAERKLQQKWSGLGEEMGFIRQALDALNEVFYVVGTDGELLGWNEHLTEVTGYTDEEISGMTVTEFFPEGQHQKVTEAMNRTVEQGSTAVESSVLTKNDREVPHKLTGSRLTAEDGEVVGLVGIGRDVSHRRERERELEERKRQLKAVIDSVEASIWIRDTESRFLLLNQAFRDLFGISEDESVIGRPLEETLPEEVAAQFRENDRTAMEKKEPTEIEEEVQTQNGVRTYLTRIKPLFDEDGEVYGTCGIASDITEHKRYEKRLENQRQRLDDFAGVVSHDLKNPLSIIQGHLEEAERTGDPEHFEACRRATDRMDDIIDDLLSLARSTNDTKSKEAVSLAEVAKDSWQNTETETASLDIETDTEIVADEGQLRQLLENLFNNSAKHGGNGVTVTVTDTQLGNGFRVEDDGGGIPEQDREKVFDPGYSKADDGTGLGLYIVEQVADSHGWEVTVSDGEKGGAAFEIRGVGPRNRRTADA